MKNKTIVSITLIIAIIFWVFIPINKRAMANGINKIPNPSFEEEIHGWVGNYSTSLQISNEAHTGEKSLLLTHSGISYREATLSIQNILEEFGTGEYYFGIWVKSKMSINIFFKISDNLDGIRPIGNSGDKVPIDEWTLIEGGCTFKPNAQKAQIKIYTHYSTDFYIDDIVMAKGAKPPSTPIPKLKNLITNPSYEDGIYPGILQGVDCFSLTTNAHTGSKALAYNPGTNVGKYAALSYELSSIVGTNGIGVYSFSASLKKLLGSEPKVCFSLEVDGIANLQKTSYPIANWDEYVVEINITEEHLSANSLKLVIYEEEYNQRFIIDDISLTKDCVYCLPSISLNITDNTNFVIGINDWNPEHSYQIWSYQEISLGILDEDEENTNQWVLSKPYTLGKDRTQTEGFIEIGEALACNIGEFNPVDNKYKVALKVIDSEGKFISQVKDIFTKADVGEPVIRKITVDGEMADEKTIVRQIIPGGSIGFVVTGNYISGMEYEAKIYPTGQELIPIEENKFHWDISNLEPGNYCVNFKAKNNKSEDNKKIKFTLYKPETNINYGIIEDMQIETTEEEEYKINISTNVLAGNYLAYKLSEPWCTPFENTNIKHITEFGKKSEQMSIPLDSYGIYQVGAYAYKDQNAPDDGAIRTINYSRGEVYLNVTVDDEKIKTNNITKTKGEEITINPTAIGIPQTQENPICYSFWRRDARGWILIRNYKKENNITWKPNRVGTYTIQIRAKLKDGLTYEVIKNIEFEITHEEVQKAKEAIISINQTELQNSAKSRTPILITADAICETKDLLFKYIISNEYIYYIESAFSPDPTYMWIPTKPGEYTINVLIKNNNSFGKYDGINSFKIDVE